MTNLATQIRPTDGAPPPGAASDLPAARLHLEFASGTRTGGLRGAKLHIDGETTPRCSWATENSDDALPVVVSHETAIWAPATAHPASTASELWFTPEQPSPVATTPPADWWSRFDDLARSAAPHVAPQVPPMPGVSEHGASAVGDVRATLEPLHKPAGRAA